MGSLRHGRGGTYVIFMVPIGVIFSHACARCFVPHPKYPSKTPTARPCKAKADDAFDAIVSESDPKLRKWMAMVMKKETEVAMAMAMAQKETEVAMAQKETEEVAMAQKETEVAMAQKEAEVAMAQKEMEVAQAKMALLQSQLDQKNRDLLAARGEMSARYMLERYVDKIKAEARPAETRTKPLLRQVQKLQNQSSAAQQMVDAVKACATLSNQPSVFLSDLFAHVSGQFHFPNWCGPGIKVSPSLNKAERCVLEKLAALEGFDINVDEYEETDGEAGE